MKRSYIALTVSLLEVFTGLLSAFLGVWVGLTSPVYLAFLLFGAAAVNLLVFIHMRQGLLVRAEEEELQAIISEREGKEGLFRETVEEPFSARARLRQMENWFLPAVSLVIGFYMILVSILRFKGYFIPGEPFSGGRTLVAALAIAGMAFLLFVIGKYVTGLSEAAQYNLIRSPGFLTIFCAICSFLVFCSIIMLHLGLPKVEVFAGYMISILTGLLGIELVVNFVAHFYTPKSAELPYRPPYESRILHMVISRSGFFRTVAESLDYQFGFKVSQAWLYRFIERAIAPLVFFEILAFYGLTCLVIVNPEEEAVIEHLGSPSEKILQPGLHFKLPWPVDRAIKFPTRRIQKLILGLSDDEEDLVLWTREHGHKKHYLIVGSAEIAPHEEKESGAVPVNLLSVHVSVLYRVNNLKTFLYGKIDPVGALEAVSYRELMRFMINVDLFEIMGPGRLRASEYLTSRIGEGSFGTGLEVVFVGFESAHPPAEVASSFEGVVGAIEEKYAKVLEAEAYINRILPLAEYEQSVLRERAESYRFRRETVSEAAVQEFRYKDEADRKLSKVYRIRKFLGVLEDTSGDVRKYIVPRKPGARQITVIDVKEKLRPELLNMDLSGLEEEK